MSHHDAARRMAADCLCFRARRATRTITRLYDEALRPLGLGATQLTLMNAIAMGGEKGQPMSRLSDILALDLTSLSRNLRPLEKRGMLTVGRDEIDRRVRVIRLTREGEALLVAALPYWTEAHARVTAMLGAAEAEALRAGLDAVTSALRRSQEEES